MFPQTPFRLPSITLYGCVGQPIATFRALGVFLNPSAGYYDPALPTVGVRFTTRPSSRCVRCGAGLSCFAPSPLRPAALRFGATPSTKSSTRAFITVAAALTLRPRAHSDCALVGAGPVARALHSAGGAPTPRRSPRPAAADRLSGLRPSAFLSATPPNPFCGLRALARPRRLSAGNGRAAALPAPASSFLLRPALFRSLLPTCACYPLTAVCVGYAAAPAVWVCRLRVTVWRFPPPPFKSRRLTL